MMFKIILITLTTLTANAAFAESAIAHRYQHHNVQMRTHMVHYKNFKPNIQLERITQSTCAHQWEIYNRYYKYGQQWYVNIGRKCQFCAKIEMEEKMYPIHYFGKVWRTSNGLPIRAYQKKN
tara:strand:+ start:1784 stop:2149 length:366 start_codon:yes stop_codon:yes gene_type:complete